MLPCMHYFANLSFLDKLLWCISVINYVQHARPRKQDCILLSLLISSEKHFAFAILFKVEINIFSIAKEGSINALSQSHKKLRQNNIFRA